MDKTNKNFYYIFDYDDNLLFLPTTLHVEKYENNKWVKKDISSSEYREIRKDLLIKNGWKYYNDDVNYTYSDFGDNGSRGDKALLEDTIYALENKNYGPSWDSFKKCIINGNIFMIVTARGHEPNTIKNVIRYIILNYLDNYEIIDMIKNLKIFNAYFSTRDTYWTIQEHVDYYLNNCDFIGISSNYFKTNFDNDVCLPVSPEKSKSVAIKYFVNKISQYGIKYNKEISVGFSDDDLNTVEHVYKYIRDELSLLYPIEYNIFPVI